MRCNLYDDKNAFVNSCFLFSFVSFLFPALSLSFFLSFFHYFYRVSLKKKKKQPARHMNRMIWTRQYGLNPNPNANNPKKVFDCLSVLS